MSFYDLSKDDRAALVEQIKAHIAAEVKKVQIKASSPLSKTVNYFSDEDTYIRKSAYLSVGRIYIEHKEWQPAIISVLKRLLKQESAHIRQTVINAAGEIGKQDFETVQSFFEIGLFDDHHSVRNAVIGSVKKMSEKNPVPVLNWSKQYLYHPDKEIRREICHGIELRGRTHPQDILPLLKELQHDTTARVRSTLVHVIGQIAYKKGCLKTVIADLNTWENKALVKDAIDEIIDVHHRYRNFAVLTQEEAIEYIRKYYKK
ncbi:MAG: HEAT repeat domain-containing protein [Bacteroidetes bacterium]|nr:HEAT repeat domain-containing protein [Bacteroidota bacterium]